MFSFLSSTVNICGLNLAVSSLTLFYRSPMVFVFWFVLFLCRCSCSCFVCIVFVFFSWVFCSCPYPSVLHYSGLIPPFFFDRVYSFFFLLFLACIFHFRFGSVVIKISSFFFYIFFSISSLLLAWTCTVREYVYFAFMVNSITRSWRLEPQLHSCYIIIRVILFEMN